MILLTVGWSNDIDDGAGGCGVLICRCRLFISLTRLYSGPIRWAAQAIALGRISKRCVCRSPRSSPPASTEGTLQGPRSLGDSVRALTAVIPASPSDARGFLVLPRTTLVNLAGRSLKARGLPKALKFVLVSKIAPTHHEIESVTIKRTRQMRIRIDNSLLDSRAPRPKAAANAIVLSINGVEPTNHATIADLLTYDQSGSECGRLYRIARVSNRGAPRRRLRR